MECMCLWTIGTSTIGICWCILEIGSQNSEDTISKVKIRVTRTYWFGREKNLFSNLVKNTVQVQGGLMNVFSGQSALQHEFGYNLGRFMSKLVFLPTGLVYLEFRFGNDTRIYHRNTNTSVQRCLESTNGSFRFGFEVIMIKKG